MAIEWSRGGYEVSDDLRRLDLGAVHRFISKESYWAEGISEALLARAIAHSLCFGLHRGPEQVGFARVVTDRATYGYLCDVYVDRAHRGKGLGKWLVDCVLKHPDLQGLRRIALMTRDAHDLYRPFGFQAMPEATRYLEIHRPDAYKGKEEVPA
jgi:ribosomal protein S18 acetylase RimI-like enzyme